MMRENCTLINISHNTCFQLSKCVLAWWPIKTIKWYESLSRQQFNLEAGPRAPMGEGVYVFKTRGDQDNQIFDQLDTFVMEAAGLCQVSRDLPSFTRAVIDVCNIHLL